MIVAKLKLAQILRKMLRTDMDMRPADPALQLRPEAFHAVDGATSCRDILPKRMVDLFMVETVHSKSEIGRQFVGVDDGVWHHVLLDDRDHRADTAVRDNLGYNVATALNHSQNDRFVGKEAFFLRCLSADERLVNLNLFAKAAERRVAIDLAHVFADFVAHAPSRLVGHAKLALDLLCGNATPRRAEQKHNVEPVAQRSASAFKWSIGHRGNLVAAVFA